MSENTPVAPGAQLYQFTLKDADGNEHQYSGAQFGATEGEKILWELVTLIGPSMGSLLVAWVNGDGDMSSMDLSLDAGTLGQELTRALRMGNMPGLRRGILLQTFRDGEALHKKEVFDRVYAANYLELLLVQKEVLRVNRLFLGLATLLANETPKKAEPSGDPTPAQSDGSPNTPPAEA
jgi:hypothetical protein